LSFAEKALDAERRRIERIRSRLQQRQATTYVAPPVTDESHPDLGVTFHRRQTCNHTHGHNHSDGNGYAYAQDTLSPDGGQLETESDHSQSSASLQHTNTGETTNTNTIETPVSHASLEKHETKPAKNCIHSQHFHYLDGRCGHQVLVHKPSNGQPHIDFVVDGKIECYEDCNPVMEGTAVWPSSLQSRGSIDDNEVTNICDDNKCKPAYDPKILDLKDIDMNCGEWQSILPEQDSQEPDEEVINALFRLGGD